MVVFFDGFPIFQQFATLALSPIENALCEIKEVDDKYPNKKSVKWLLKLQLKNS